jgi:hypothetical protein
MNLKMLAGPCSGIRIMGRIVVCIWRRSGLFKSKNKDVMKIINCTKF